ncbi:hypothetical protein [Nostoc sp.]|uniref:hypothetical protein n=1 Tax=Nostoc sp. TaxID=1180 RepID=UPI002FEF47A3
MTLRRLIVATAILKYRKGGLIFESDRIHNASDRIYNASHRIHNASHRIYNASHHIHNASHRIYNASHRIHNASHRIYSDFQVNEPQIDLTSIPLCYVRVAARSAERGFDFLSNASREEAGG